MSPQALTSNDGRINYLGVDQILFDYIVNYVFPQYTLPWNNFYTNIDAEPFYQRNEQRNTNAVLAKTPHGVDAKPQLVIISAEELPVWSHTVRKSGTGNVLDTTATKTLLGKLYSKHCAGIDYQYVYNGILAGVNPTSEGDSKWAIFELNLLNQAPRNKQSVVIVTDKVCRPECSEEKPAVYSSLNGSITINDEKTVIIKNPIPLGHEKHEKIEDLVEAGASNTVYTLYGNRIFIAIKTDDLEEYGTKIAYSFQFRISETPTLASTLTAAATP